MYIIENLLCFIFIVNCLKTELKRWNRGQIPPLYEWWNSWRYFVLKNYSESQIYCLRKWERWMNLASKYFGEVELGRVVWDGRIYITRNIKDFLIFNQQYDVLSLSKNRCGCKLKKYILIRSGHIKNIGFFALALTARVVRGSNSSFLLCRSYILKCPQFLKKMPQVKFFFSNSTYTFAPIAPNF